MLLSYSSALYRSQNFLNRSLCSPQVDSPEHKIEKERALVIMPGRQRVALPCADLPEVVLQAISAVVVRPSSVPPSAYILVQFWHREEYDSVLHHKETKSPSSLSGKLALTIIKSGLVDTLWR